ncbi:hypothetical protein [Azospirillum oleiclasticum]|uniref:8-oxoguanine DNA glycosylase n=1 Tax=Azospirillum oleiclasticum TaxID=2735135 RepID=UPI0015D4AA0C|nr:hypothetical protein [Azospirillum oleiclasticum]
MQVVSALVDGQYREWTLPNEDEEVVPGVRWGRADEVPSPAYWAALALMRPGWDGAFVSHSGTLAEEVAFCILGGFGVTAELGQAAFERLRDLGLLTPSPNADHTPIEAALMAPLSVAGRQVRYRFPRQRAARLAIAMRELHQAPPSEDDPLAFRNALLRIPGIGPKTASWVARNWLGTDDVAILDIHILRACRVIGVIEDTWTLPRDYAALERRFLAFATGIGVPASVLDAIMWTQMRILGVPETPHTRPKMADTSVSKDILPKMHGSEVLFNT